MRPSRSLPSLRTGNTKLNVEIVKKIRERHGAGEPAEQLATDYGVTATNIRDVVNRVTWKHVP